MQTSKPWHICAVCPEGHGSSCLVDVVVCASYAARRCCWQRVAHAIGGGAIAHAAQAGGDSAYAKPRPDR